MIFTEAAKSFYSRPFYHTLARSTGIGMRFIFLLIIVSTAWTTLTIGKTYPEMNQLIAMVPEFSQKLPAVTYKDNKLSIDKPVPYSLRFGPVPRDYGMVIDTNYKITDLDALTKYMKQNHVILMVTEDRMITLKANQGDLDIRDLRDFKEPFTITHDDWSKIAAFIVKWGAFTFYAYMAIIMLVAFIFYHFFATFIDSIIVQIMSAIAGAGLEFEACMRLAAAARIPIVVLPMVHKIFESYSWIVWISYLGFAVIAAKGKKEAGSAT